MEPYYSNGRVTIYNGDWIEVLKTLPDESVHCVVTSPPYWGLRDYGTASWVGGNPNCDHVCNHGVQGKTAQRADRTFTAQAVYKRECGKCGAKRVDGQLGLESTPQEYLAKMVEGFREVRRVLRSDGTLWLNMGDSYANDAQAGGGDPTIGDRNIGGEKQPKMPVPCGFKPKDLMGMPWRVAFALQEDGWYLRAQCPWIKRNAMPESVRDRPGTATETIFLLSKSARYFYDAEAVKMPAAGTAHARGSGVNPKAAAHNNSRKERAKTEHMRGPTETMNGIRPRQNESFSAAVKDVVPARGRRNHDWFMDSWEGLLTDDDGDPMAFVVNPAPFPEAHFATFPEALVKPCILAGTSEKGCCPKCGAPWRRVIEKVGTGRTHKLPSGMATYEGGHSSVHRDGRELEPIYSEVTESQTTGWQPSCECREWRIPECMSGDGPYETIPEPVPCTVLDPFWGSGTTGKVALMNHCRVIGVDIKGDYLDMSLASRLAQNALEF